MYDQDTASLIRSTPPLEGLDRENLPDLLSEAFAQIAAARIRLRNSDEESPDELQSLVRTIRRLAFTNEALVSILPERDDRSSASLWRLQLTSFVSMQTGFWTAKQRPRFWTPIVYPAMSPPCSYSWSQKRQQMPVRYPSRCAGIQTTR